MGFRGRYQNKRDANEPEIVAAFLAHGFSVARLDQPADLLVGKHGRTWLVEVKIEGAKLNAKQREFRDAWRGQFDVVRSVEDVAEFAREVKSEAPQA
jgi:hypothetical protein